MTEDEMKEKLGCSVVSKKRNGNFVAKWSYFYTHAVTPEDRKLQVLKAYNDALVIDLGDHWHDFVGGAKTGGYQDSYMWVEFKLMRYHIKNK